MFHRLSVPIVSAIVLCGGANLAIAQRLQVQAVPGIPFGVGRITMNLPDQLDEEVLDTSFFSITEADGRVFYPAMRLTRPLGIFREVVGALAGDGPNQLHVHFLFTGSAPLEVTLHTPHRIVTRVLPSGRPVAHRRLMRAWWIRYKAAARKQQQEGDYPPVVETYLTTMLSQRLGLPLPEVGQDFETGKSLALLLGTEKLRLQMLRDAVVGRSVRDEPTDRPVPADISWADVTHPEVDREIFVEPIANHVPQECFYIRFAQFPNYLWLRRLLEEYGGDLSRMVTLRGTDDQLNRRVEQQLGLKESSLARVLGDKVISDVALIGRDTFLREGAAIGILFEAKNELLARDLQSQRQRAVQESADAGATMQTIQIEDHDVSLASTPDHRLRSFYVQDGIYHLVTNCRAIAERFLQSGRGQRSLGQSAEFRHARYVMPLEEANTIFVYLSRAFFEGLLTPQYQLELPRRLMAATDGELMQLARLAAAAEGYSDADMDQLVNLGFLATAVDRRPDGSFTKIAGGRAVDSLRGARGSFLPIPDTPLDHVTASELAHYRRIRDFHQQTWQQMDPVLIGLTRTALDEQVERVVIDARMLPYNKEKFGAVLDAFGPPTTIRVTTPVDDVISFQAVIDGGSLARSVPLHNLFFGIRDAEPLATISKGQLLKSLQILRNAPAYLGAWPKPGLLDRLGFHGRPDGYGFRRMLFGLYRLETPTGFSLLGFDRSILAEVAPQLGTEAADDAAQVRVHVGDIKSSKFGKWANDLNFQRAWETSVGNVHLLHLLSQQLKVPLPEAKTVAERLLDARLVCPLGGEYQLVDESGKQTRWASSVWLAGKRQSQGSYVSPLMNWLRGLEATMAIDEDRIVARGVLDIQRSKQEEGAIKLPLFEFFRGNSKAASPPSGSAKPLIETDPEELPPPPPQPPAD